MTSHRPLSSSSLKLFLTLVKDAVAEGGKIEYGGNVIKDNYVEPTIVTGLAHDAAVVHRYSSENFGAKFKLLAGNLIFSGRKD